MGRRERGDSFTSTQQESQRETDLQPREVMAVGPGDKHTTVFLTRCRGPQRLAGPRRTESLLVHKGQRDLGTIASPCILRRYLRWVKVQNTRGCKWFQRPRRWWGAFNSPTPQSCGGLWAEERVPFPHGCIHYSVTTLQNSRLSNQTSL